MSQQDTKYWETWQGRTTVQRGKACTTKFWDQSLSLWDATKRCDDSRECIGLLVAYNQKSSLTKLTELHTGKHQFQGCTGISDGGGVNWISLTKNFKSVAVSGKEIKINFQPAGSKVFPNWNIDTGEMYGTRGNGLIYGWRCKNHELMAKNDYQDTKTVYDTWVSALDRRACNQGKQQVWELKVENGVYEVTTTWGSKKTRLLGGRCAT